MKRGKPVRHRLLKAITLAYDTVASGAALAFSVWIVQPNFLTPNNNNNNNVNSLFLAYVWAFSAVACVCVFSQRLYRGIWRYTSFGDCVDIFRASALTVMVFVPAAFLTTRAADLPRSSTLIAGLLMMALLACPRVLSRSFADRRIPSLFTATGGKSGANAVPVLLIGKATRAESFLRNLQKQHLAQYSVSAVLTDESAWHGRTMHGVGVLGGPPDLEDTLSFLQQRKVHPQRLVIADDQIDKEGIAAYLDLANRHGLTLGRLPKLMDVNHTQDEGTLAVQPVVLGDLLDRPQVVPDCDGLRRLIENKRVLVSGGGGSIGSELVRQLSDRGPAELVLVENTEFNLYAIDRELEERHPELKRVPLICDVRDRGSLNKCFAEHRPDIVFHAAALKHVPMVELNPIEGIRTNALGTQTLADASVRYGVSTMVLISTDKAVNPHNVMGASKRCAEAYCQALDAQGGPTRFVAVRFGNVLGSTGSVVPLFQRQLAAGGPITVTHPDIERYFMTIPEAVRLVLQASVLGASDTMPRGHVYVLDMGKPIKIAELARRMIRLAGKEPDKDIKVVYTGLRPGEKLYEELAHAQEELNDTPVRGVMMVSPRTLELSIIQRQFAAIAEAAASLDREKVLAILRAIVPEFRGEEEASAPAARHAAAAGPQLFAVHKKERRRAPLAPTRVPLPVVGGDTARVNLRIPEAGDYSGA